LFDFVKEDETQRKGKLRICAMAFQIFIRFKRLGGRSSCGEQHSLLSPHWKQGFRLKEVE
jgi:hypothetical protein